MNRLDSSTKRFLWSALLYAGFLLLGVVVLARLFRKEDVAELYAIVAGARWEYVGLSLLLTGGGHWVRALRWGQLLQGSGHPVGTGVAFAALMNGYFVNLAVPRLGEATRCAVVWRSHRVPGAASAGTVVVERVVDILSLMVILMLTFVVVSAELQEFFLERIWMPLREALLALAWGSGGVGLGLLFALVLILVGMMYLMLRVVGRNTWIRLRFRELRTGLLSFREMRGKGRFLVYTLLIWLSYFSAPLCTLLALDTGTNSLWEIALVTFAVGSIARTIPAPVGSAGPYHWLVSQVLLVYGIGEIQGLAVATLNHSVQTLFYILVGLGAWLGLAVILRKRPDPA